METKVYDLNSLPRAITTGEAEALTQMFDSEGWRVWMDMKRINALASAEIGMGLTSEENDRIMHRAVYHALLTDLAAREEYKKNLSETEAVGPDELDVDVKTPPDLGTVKLKTL